MAVIYRAARCVRAGPRLTRRLDVRYLPCSVLSCKQISIAGLRDTDCPYAYPTVIMVPYPWRRLARGLGMKT